MVWIISAVVIVVAAMLVYAWRIDHRGSARRLRVKPSYQDRAVGEAKSEVYRRDIGGMGPGRGP